MPIIGELFCPNIKNLSKLEILVFRNQTFSAQPKQVNPKKLFHDKPNVPNKK
jgi:hypothetical protein